MNETRAREVLRAAVPQLPATEGRVTLDLEGETAHLRLDNPRSRNALTGRMMLQLDEALGHLAGWDGGALVLSATPCGVFCAGGHLADVRTGLTEPEVGRAMVVLMTAVLDRLLDASFISVAAVDGLALGGGAELLTATDFRVATPDARVHFVQARLGVATGWGGARRLVAHVGRRTALDWLTHARAVDAEAASAAGFFDQVAHGEVLETAQRFLAPRLAHPSASLRAVKRQIAARNAQEASEAFLDVWGGPAHRKALGLE